MKWVSVESSEGHEYHLAGEDTLQLPVRTHSININPKNKDTDLIFPQYVKSKSFIVQVFRKT